MCAGFFRTILLALGMARGTTRSFPNRRADIDYRQLLTASCGFGTAPSPHHTRRRFVESARALGATIGISFSPTSTAYHHGSPVVWTDAESFRQHGFGRGGASPGCGHSPPDPSWGNMLTRGKARYRIAPG